MRINKISKHANKDYIKYGYEDLHIWIIYAPLIGIREFKINEEKQSEAS